MGIAKSIEGYTVSTIYNANIDLFVKEIGERLNADFEVSIYNEEVELIGIQNKKTNFYKQICYKLTIQYQEQNINGEKASLPVYNLLIPIQNCYDQEVEITFYPNNFVQLFFLTFEYLWISFVETLKSIDLFEDRNISLQRYENLRIQYIPIMKKLKVESLIIITNACYYTGEGTEELANKIMDFSDLIKVATEIDKLKIFNFEEILYTSNIDKIDKKFIETNYLKIAIHDTFKINELIFF